MLVKIVTHSGQSNKEYPGVWEMKEYTNTVLNKRDPMICADGRMVHMSTIDRSGLVVVDAETGAPVEKPDFTGFY